MLKLPRVGRKGGLKLKKKTTWLMDSHESVINSGRNSFPIFVHNYSMINPTNTSVISNIASKILNIDRETSFLKEWWKQNGSVSMILSWKFNLKWCTLNYQAVVPFMRIIFDRIKQIITCNCYREFSFAILLLTKCKKACNIGACWMQDHKMFQFHLRLQAFLNAMRQFRYRKTG